MREHDSRILDDESKQIFIQFELSIAKRLKNTLNKDLLKQQSTSPKKVTTQFQLINYHLRKYLYSMLTDKITTVMITHLFKVAKK